MKNEHITDNDIQQFLFNDLIIDQKIREHVQSCNECKLRVDQYKLIFEAVSQMEKPEFDFDLTEAIMKTIPGKKPQYSFAKTLVAISGVLIVSIAGMLSYFLKIDLIALISGIAPISIYLILTVLISFVLFHCFDIFRHYKKKMDLINSY